MSLLAFDPVNPQIPLGDWIATGISWLTDTFQFVFDGVDIGLQAAFDGLATVFNAPSYIIMTLILAVIGGLVRSWPFAIYAAAGFYLVRGLDQWQNAMNTFALVLIATAIAVILAVPLGIWAAKSPLVSRLIRPVLDLMQTMPALVYLIPALAAFGIGEVPGIVATVVFSMPPGVRFTELAIRQVDTEVVEAGQAFGSSPGRILRQIQLPLALPTIMAGINQVIMLALSMVVLAAFVGAVGLGQPVQAALGRVDVAGGMAAGVAVVIIAVYLDRLVAALSDRAPVARAARARD